MFLNFIYILQISFAWIQWAIKSTLSIHILSINSFIIFSLENSLCARYRMIFTLTRRKLRKSHHFLHQLFRIFLYIRLFIFFIFLFNSIHFFLVNCIGISWINLIFRDLIIILFYRCILLNFLVLTIFL